MALPGGKLIPARGDRLALDHAGPAGMDLAHQKLGFRFTLDGKNVPEELQEAVMALQGEYVPSEHEQLGETRNAALSDELGLTDFLADRFAVAGTPAECLAKVGVIRDAGVDTLLITAIGPQPDVIIERFGREVAALSG